MNGTISIHRIKPLNSILKYFSDRASERRAEHERSEAEYELHKKKGIYLDSLQLNLNNILHDDSVIVVNNDKVRGYSIMLCNNEADLKNWSEFIRKNITISVDAKNLDDVTISLMDYYVGQPIKKFSITNCEEYISAKDAICNYVKYGPGSWILRKE